MRRLTEVVIRPAAAGDLPDLRRAVVELQEYERRLHPTRLPGEQIADAYVAWLQQQAAEKSGAVLVAECDESFAGFAVGWIVEHDHIAVSEDANRFGYVSDLCVMPSYRGRRIAHRLLDVMEHRLGCSGITRLFLWTLAANTSARASYESAGFTPYEIIYEKLVGKDATDT